jgi:uncharacterized Zn finger protein
MISRCPGCGDESEFREIKDCVYQCSNCGYVVREGKRREFEVDVVFSDDAESQMGKLALEEGDEVRVGEEYVVEISGELRIGEVRAIDVEEGRVERAQVERIKTIWMRAVDFVSVPVSIHLGSRTISKKIRLPGDEELRVGDVIRIEGAKHTIKAIKRRFGRLVKEGSVKAKEIKRMYVK